MSRSTWVCIFAGQFFLLALAFAFTPGSNMSPQEARAARIAFEAQEYRDKILAEAWQQAMKNHILRTDPSSPYYQGNK
jgi:hypothetical protein